MSVATDASRIHGAGGAKERRLLFFKVHLVHE